MNNPEEEKKEEKNLLALSEVEELINKKAQEIASNMRLGAGLKFAVRLMPGDVPVVKMERGTTVNIYIAGASIASKEFWDMIRSALRNVRKLQESAALTVYNDVYAREQREGKTKWSKLTYKNDRSEVLPIIAKDRIRTKVITTVIVEDLITKKSVTVSSDVVGCNLHEMSRNAIVRLSQDVKLYENEQDRLEKEQTDNSSEMENK